MPFFRKKPVMIEARQVTIENAPGIEEWTSGVAKRVAMRAPDSWWMWVRTLEGGHVAQPGDWIIQGVNGEFYPCKPDIFAKTYEPAARSPSSGKEPSP